MPWEGIAYVTSGITLAAFVAAIIVWFFRDRNIEREKTLQAAIEKNNHEVVKNLAEFFDIDTTRLSKKDQAEIAMIQIRARERRFLISAAVLVLLFLIFGGLAGVSIVNSIPGPTPTPTPIPSPTLPPTPSPTPTLDGFKYVVAVQSDKNLKDAREHLAEILPSEQNPNSYVFLRPNDPYGIYRTARIFRDEETAEAQAFAKSANTKDETVISKPELIETWCKDGKWNSQSYFDCLSN